MTPPLLDITAADYDDLIGFWRQQEGVGLHDSDERGPFELYLRRNTGLSLVAREEGRVVAAVLCGHDGRRGYLDHLAVAASHRGRGLGRRIVTECLRRLSALGILRCNVVVYADNQDGERFWVALGWKPRADLKVMQVRLSSVASV